MHEFQRTGNPLLAARNISIVAKAMAAACRLLRMAIDNTPALKGCRRLSTIKSAHFRLTGQDLSARSPTTTRIGIPVPYGQIPSRLAQSTIRQQKRPASGCRLLWIGTTTGTAKPGSNSGRPISFKEALLAVCELQRVQFGEPPGGPPN